MGGARRRGAVGRGGGFPGRARPSGLKRPEEPAGEVPRRRRGRDSEGFQAAKRPPWKPRTQTDSSAQL